MGVSRINITFVLSLTWELFTGMSAVLPSHLPKGSEVPGNPGETHVYFSQRCGRHCWWQVS